MKLSAVAVVLLALGVVLGLALRDTVADAAPPWATIQYVDDSIEALNQAVVEPIAVAVAELEGDVTDLDQRVGALETAPPPQQREDQITLFAEMVGSQALHCSGCSPQDWSFFGSDTEYPIIALDASDYPATSSFRLDATFTDHAAFEEGCMRLFDLTETAAVSGSDVCFNSGAVPIDLLRLRSGPFQISDGEHEYALQSRGLSGRGKSAFLIIEWTE
jgi:hypothetical protein